MLLTMVLEARAYSKNSNTARIMKMFKLGAALQPPVYHKLRIVKVSNLFIASLRRPFFY